ncbi:MAG: aminotransferase class III-fold pyridoxal phosphate-dependent enzyme, partial [Candidatus Eremiobacteraeota bacterium]|nr:aminotransferase class III-fold pyridoxal phosphate-dependent enzyme [Candidatus Eremiobacteraeota bacterium]
SNGVIVFPDGYLKRVRELCDRHGILLIFDEVMTGFGRTGEAFASQRFGVAPDMLTFAKGVTSAYVPLGGVAVRESLAKFFDAHPLPSGHTFSGHPVAAAAGLAAIEAYRNEGLFARARVVEGWLRSRFDALAERHRIIGEARGVGAFFGLELVTDRDTREPLVEWQGGKTLHSLFGDLLARGLYIYGRYNVIVVSPPLTIGEAELDEAMTIFDEAFAEFAKIPKAG